MRRRFVARPQERQPVASLGARVRSRVFREAECDPGADGLRDIARVLRRERLLNPTDQLGRSGAGWDHAVEPFAGCRCRRRGNLRDEGGDERIAR